MRLSRLLTATTATLALIAGPLAMTAAEAAPSAPQAASAVASGWTPRPEDYPKTVTRKDLPITMTDGKILKGDLILPADADGKEIAGRFPVVVTITAYNKSVMGMAGGLAGGDPSYLVKRGYAQLTVDARGTGSSAGQWCAFCTREDKDATEVLQWAHEQPWSNGDTAMTGPSYMGISQIFAAAGQPDGLKALFPQVPAADVYRDVVASGGALDVGFIPLWLGLVTLTGVIPPMTVPTDASPLTTLIDHLIAGGTFTLPLLLTALAGGDTAYDGDFYTQRSPINVAHKVMAPTFLIGGEYDLFQRGTPLLFENLQRRGVPTKMILGPWDHLQGSSGAEVAKAGYGTLAELQLRWFDHYVRGVADPALDSDIPPVTYYEQGTGAWKSTSSWVGSDRAAASYLLSGTSSTGGANGALTLGTPAAGSSTLLPIPVAGLCTRSANQWTAGMMNMIPIENPCFTDNAFNDRLGLVFETEPVTKPVSFQGPLNARLYVSSPTGGGMLSVAVEDVAPDGKVNRISGGWQTISFAGMDKSRSRYLDGQLIQPYYPFTKDSAKKLTSGEVREVNVEVFPTAASVQAGHRLRLAVQAFDVPHLLPTLANLFGSLTTMTVRTGPQYPSALTLPVERAGAGNGGGNGGGTTGPVAGATTLMASKTVARIKHRPAKRHHRNKAIITVTVPAARATATGKVRVYVDGRLVTTRALRSGVVRVPIVKRYSKKPGRHTLRVVYTGTSLVAPSTVTRHWKVR